MNLAPSSGNMAKRVPASLGTPAIAAAPTLSPLSTEPVQIIDDLLEENTENDKIVTLTVAEKPQSTHSGLARRLSEVFKKVVPVTATLPESYVPPVKSAITVTPLLLDSCRNSDEWNSNIEQQNTGGSTQSQSDKPKKLRRKSSMNNNNNSGIPPPAPPKDVEASSTRPGSASRRFSAETVERSIAAKIYFEHYFDRLFSGKSSNPSAGSSRSRRRIQIEQELDRLGVSDAEKTKIREEWIAKEHALSRISRDKMSMGKFQVIKALGRGAFGYVQLVREHTTGMCFAMKILKKEDMLRNNQESHVRAERDMLSDAAADDSCRWLIKLFYSFQDVDHLYFVMEFCPGGDLLSLLIQFDTFPEDMARFYAAEMLLCIEETHRLGYVHRDIKPDNFLLDARGHLRLGDCGLATDFHWSHETKYYEALRKHMYHAADCENPSGTCSCISKSKRIEADLLTSEQKELDEYIAATENHSQHSGSGSGSGSHPQPPLSTKLSDKTKNDETTTSTDVFCHPPDSHHLLTWRLRARLKHPHIRTYSVVGTNNYIAPEVLQAQPYDYSCDWWSLGIILFEMLYGYPPFASKTRDGTRLKIIDWKRWLKFPSYVTRKTGENEYDYAGEISREGRDLIRKLLCDQKERLGSAVGTLDVGGKSTATQSSANNRDAARSAAILSAMLLGKDGQEIRKHPWFHGVDFDRIMEKDAPWRPELSSDADTHYFEEMSQDDTVMGPYGAGLGKTTELMQPAAPSPNKGQVLVVNSIGKEQDDIGAAIGAGEAPLMESLTEEGGGGEDSTLIDLRKKLAFTGFTFKGKGAAENLGSLGGGSGGGSGGAAAVVGPRRPGTAGSQHRQ